MVRPRALLPLLVLLAAALAAQAQPYWLTGPTSTFAYTRFDGTYHPDTRQVYFTGGRLGDGNTDGNIYSYDPAAGTYASLGTALSTPVSNYTLVLLNVHDGSDDSLLFHVVGGRNGSGAGVTDVQTFYATLNISSTVTTDPWPGRVGGSGITQPAQGCVECGNKLYAIGGLHTSVAPYASDSVYVYDPMAAAGSRWSTLPYALSLARGYVVPAVVDGKIFAIGGDIFDGTYLYAQTTVECFDPANPTLGWQAMAGLPTPLGEGQAWGFDTGDPYGLGGYIILAGGGAWPADTNLCFIYNVAANTWTSFPWNLNYNRRNHAGVLVTDTAYAAGDPGIWVFGGRSGSDANVLNIPEYIPMPFPPLSVDATPVPYGASLAWQGMSGTVLGYKIYRSAASGGPYDSIGVSAVNAYTDNSAPAGATYYYVIKARYQIGSKTAESMYSPEAACYVGVSGGPSSRLPVSYQLAQCRPNPVAGPAEIRFALPSPGHVRLGVYDASGRLVRRLADRQYPAGYHQVRWNGRTESGARAAAGVYFLRLTSGAFTATSKITVVR